jgi:UDP-2,3-diacylglucosamine hydrolase
MSEDRVSRPSYFVSDAHLGGYPEVEATSIPLLHSLLEEILSRKGDLYIVGDLIDFWIEYSSVVPRKPFKVLARLSSMVDAGCRVAYVAGNHDFWMGDFLSDEVGLETYPEYLETTIGGRRFYISHGDGVATTGDTGYRTLKSFLHNPLVTATFKALHPDIGLFLARRFSQSSRKRSSSLDEDNEHLLHSFTKKKARQGFDYVILGHMHKPYTFEAGGATCLVVGDWISHFTYGLFNDGKLELKHYGVRS